MQPRHHFNLPRHFWLDFRWSHRISWPETCVRCNIDWPCQGNVQLIYWMYMDSVRLRLDRIRTEYWMCPKRLCANGKLVCERVRTAHARNLKRSWHANDSHEQNMLTRNWNQFAMDLFRCNWCSIGRQVTQWRVKCINFWALRFRFFVIFCTCNLKGFWKPANCVAVNLDVVN